MLDTLRYIATAARRLLRRNDSLYVGNGQILARSAFGGLIYLDAEDISLTPSIAFTGRWEPGVVRAFQRQIRPGMTVVDVGANCGYYTLAAGIAVGSAGRVVSIEANPRMAMLVQKSVRVNGFHERIRVVQGAVSDVPGTLELGIPGEFMGSASFLVKQEGRTETVKVLQCEAKPLGDWLVDTKVDVLKIDAEGAEPLIWKGAEPIIAANPNIVVFLEFAPPMVRHTIDPAEFLRSIRGHGFHIRTVHPLTGATSSVTDADLLSREWSELILQRTAR